jgi:hypothetical protein
MYIQKYIFVDKIYILFACQIHRRQTIILKIIYPPYIECIYYSTPPSLSYIL